MMLQITTYVGVQQGFSEIRILIFLAAPQLNHVEVICLASHFLVKLARLPRRSKMNIGSYDLIHFLRGKQSNCPYAKGTAGIAG
jgi:hypothetical protein